MGAFVIHLGALAKTAVIAAHSLHTLGVKSAFYGKAMTAAKLGVIGLVAVLGVELWRRHRAAVKSAADAHITAAESVEAMGDQLTTLLDAVDKSTTGVIQYTTAWQDFLATSPEVIRALRNMESNEERQDFLLEFAVLLSKGQS